MFYDEPVIMDGSEFDFHTTNIRLALPEICSVESTELSTEKAPEGIPQKKKLHIRFPKIKGILYICSLLLIFSVILFVVPSIVDAQKIHGFNQALESQNYHEAYILYQKYEDNNRLRDKANDKLEVVPQSLADMYSQGSITYKKLLTYFDSLASFSVLSDELSVAREVSKQLYDSRTAYHTGLEIPSISDRLKTWEAVLEADHFGYTSVKSNVADNKNQYKEAVFSEIQDCIDSGLYKRAYTLSMLLNKWYPDDRDISAKMDSLSKYANSKDSADSAYPIKISSVKVSAPDSKNYVDLFISWENISAKTITEIKFYVVPYNNIGNAVADKDHLYSEFCAIDKRTFAPGEIVSSNTWGWENAWRNPDITKASVIKAEITFADGIQKIFEKVF